MDHSTLPSIASAQLPARYEAAKVAIAQCSQIDECKDWSDKSQALASYAKQSQDKEMEKHAMRIRARAIRRCGELLKEIEKAQGKQERNPDGTIRAGTHPNGRGKAAGEAGLSPNQAKQAIRVANVEPEDFEEQVESEEPPTITKGPHAGQIVSVDHTLPRSLVDELDEKLFNLRVMPARVNQSKGNRITPEEIQLANRWNLSGLLTDEGWRAVMDAERLPRAGH